MKQIALVGDLARWRRETDFITDMLHFTATGVVTVNIGNKGPADLTRRDLRQLFPGESLEDSMELALKKLYGQGIVDGILCLVDDKNTTFPLINRALKSIPFGIPKVAIVTGDSKWRGSKDVIHVQLPGDLYNFNPVIKISLCNTVFAISGMTLCNVQNFGSTKPLIGIIGGNLELTNSLDEKDFNYLSFPGHDTFLASLIKNGYINGLIIAREVRDIKVSIEAAITREIPVVLALEETNTLTETINKISPQNQTPIYLIQTRNNPIFFLRSQPKPEPDYPSWLYTHQEDTKFGSPGFYRSAANLICKFLP